MATALTIMDGAGWGGNTDVIVVVDDARRALRWVPRDLWCDRLGDRVNAAFRRGRHDALIAALREHEIVVEHSVCLRREATERAIQWLTLTVPVGVELDFWYPCSPNRPLEEGRKLVSFRPPAEVLTGERIHQWIGARFSLRSDTTDFDRIRRQQVLLARLLEQQFEFETVLSDPTLVARSSDAALTDLRQVDGSWQLETLDDVVDARIDGKMVLLQRGRPGQLRRAFPILMYRRIGGPPPHWPWPRLYATRDGISRQLAELARRGYTAVTQRDLYDGWNAARPLPAKPLVVSFDDGHVSVWREAFPLLSARGWPAVLNLDVSMLDRDDGVSSDMVSELVSAGWELAAGSRTHPDLTQLDRERLDDEVSGSRRDLAERFGVPVDSFCYPSGRFSPEVVRSVVRAGYLGATTVVPGLAGPDGRWTMPRVRVNRGDSGARLAGRIERLEQQWKARSVEMSA